MLQYSKSKQCSTAAGCFLQADQRHAEGLPSWRRARATRYLDAPPPYYGEVPRPSPRKGVAFDKAAHAERKQAARDAGIEWRKNPAYVEGAGWECAMGWHVAPTVRALESALAAAPIRGMPVWRPKGLGDSDISLMLLVLRERRAAVEAADARARVRTKPTEEDAERELRARLEVPPDSEADRRALAAHGVEYSVALMARSRRFGQQRGPLAWPARGHLGRRRACSAHSTSASSLPKRPRSALRARPRASVAPRLGPSAGPSARAKRGPARSAPSAVKRRGVDLSDVGAGAPTRRDDDARLDAVTPAVLRRAGAARCGRAISLQFMECACEPPHSEWAPGAALSLRARAEGRRTGRRGHASLRARAPRVRPTSVALYCGCAIKERYGRWGGPVARQGHFQTARKHLEPRSSPRTECANETPQTRLVRRLQKKHGDALGRKGMLHWTRPHSRGDRGRGTGPCRPPCEIKRNRAVDHNCCKSVYRLVKSPIGRLACLRLFRLMRFHSTVYAASAPCAVQPSRVLTAVSFAPTVVFWLLACVAITLPIALVGVFVDGELVWGPVHRVCGRWRRRERPSMNTGASNAGVWICAHSLQRLHDAFLRICCGPVAAFMVLAQPARFSQQFPSGPLGLHRSRGWRVIVRYCHAPSPTTHRLCTSPFGRLDRASVAALVLVIPLCFALLTIVPGDWKGHGVGWVGAFIALSILTLPHFLGGVGTGESTYNLVLIGVSLALSALPTRRVRRLCAPTWLLGRAHAPARAVARRWRAGASRPGRHRGVPAEGFAYATHGMWYVFSACAFGVVWFWAWRAGGGGESLTV